MRKEKKLSSFYKESWDFVVESRKEIYFAIIIFVLFGLLGFLVSPTEEIQKIIYEKMAEIVLMFEGLNAWQTIWTIFSNNLYVAFTSILFGLTAEIGTFFVDLFNGYIVGFVASEVVSQNGLLILWRLLPHGIFELPAIFIALGLGFRIGKSFFAKEKTFSVFKKALRVLVLILLPLLIIAAIIEGLLVFYI